ncbi:MAG TPA: hypothetical protein PLV68_16305, partial [Ilumatobacteraceae bacterium]|nr:hypothetical protein [Ilumatobacteraceae bacterium]
VKGPLAESGTDASNNVDCEPTPGIRNATITVTKTDSVDQPIHPGDTFSYAIVVTNNGPSTVTNVSIDDDLPNELTLVSATGVDWTCGTSDPLACTYAKTLEPNNAAPAITVVVRLAATYR